MRTQSIHSVIFLAAILCLPALGNYQYRSKLGFELKGFKTNNNKHIGWMSGLRGARYFGNSQVYYGATAHFGVPNGARPSGDHFYHGGLVIGFEEKFTRRSFLEVAFMGGYGRGRFKIDVDDLHQTSYFVFEPSVSIGVGLGKGWRGNFAISYIYANDAPHFSGVTFGFRFEHKVETKVKELKE